MTKLSDTQLAILSAACQRRDRHLLPLPSSLKDGAAQKVVASLLAREFAEEVEATREDPVWRTDNDGNRFTLLATDAAVQALGIEPDGEGEARSGVGISTAGKGACAALQGATWRKKQGARPGEPTGAESAPAAWKGDSVRRTRADSKQARLIAMLKEPDGASLEEIVAATGWQAHTVRGAVAGALKKKLGLTVTSGKVDGRGRVYRIA